MSDFALKDFIDAAVVDQLGKAFKDVWADFPIDTFKKTGAAGLEELSFTERTRHIAHALNQALPDDITKALDLLVHTLPEPLEGFEGVLNERFWLWPLGDFIRDYGEEDVDAALEACYQLTKRFTSEFAIRPLLKKAPAKCLQRLGKWSKDPNEHIRRLVSEGTRPRLPWAGRLNLPREDVLPLLESLQDDPSDYVRRSVANHLNDLGKDDPEWLPAYLAGWASDATEERMKIIKHALRNHIKQGDPAALALLGYGDVELETFTLEASDRVLLGDYLVITCSFTSTATETVPLLIDFAIHFMKTNGTLARKVFKWKTMDLEPGESVTITKRMALAQRNTRRLYPGAHKVDVQVNGVIKAEQPFELVFED